MMITLHVVTVVLSSAPASMASYYPPTASEAANVDVVGSVAPGAASANADPVRRIEEFIETQKANLDWHTVLNNTTSTRPKSLGGPTCESLSALKSVHEGGGRPCSMCHELTLCLRGR